MAALDRTESRGRARGRTLFRSRPWSSEFSHSLGQELTCARWGLIPSWHKGDLKDWRASTINARIEDAATKPSFRGAWRYGRCLIPAGGYFEWTGTKSPKQPHFFSSAGNEETLWFAGLLSVWNDLRTCAILTRAANDTVTPIHDRMPVILDSAEREDWLSGSDRTDLGEGYRVKQHAVGRLRNSVLPRALPRDSVLSRAATFRIPRKLFSSDSQNLSFHTASETGEDATNRAEWNIDWAATVTEAGDDSVDDFEFKFYVDIDPTIEEEFIDLSESGTQYYDGTFGTVLDWNETDLQNSWNNGFFGPELFDPDTEGQYAAKLEAYDDGELIAEQTIYVETMGFTPPEDFI